MALKLHPPKPGRSPNFQIRGTVSLNIAGIRKSVEVDESSGTPDKRLAETLKAALETKIINELVFGARVTRTLKDAVEGYAEAKDRSAKPLRGTQRANVLGRKLAGGGVTANLLSRFGADTLVASIDQEMVDRVINESFPHQVAASTVMSGIITPLSAVLNFAAQRKWCDVPKFQRFTSSKGRSRWPTYDEADRILAAGLPSSRPIYLFLMLTGARFGEAITLDWSDVNLQDRWAVLRNTKRNGEDRGIPLHPQIRLMLANLPGDRTGPVFLTDKGVPYCDIDRETGKRPSIKKGWLATLQRAGITDNLRIHDLRHGFATWLLKADVNERVQDKILGHASATMGSKYAHIPQDDMLQAVDRLPERGFDPDPKLLKRLAAGWTLEQRRKLMFANGRPIGKIHAVKPVHPIPARKQAG